jgi:hypothetical protein
MPYRVKIASVLLFALTVLPILSALGQDPAIPAISPSFFDSIDNRIKYLEQQIQHNKQIRDVSYLNYQRELDHTIFVQAYQQYVVNEDLDKAMDLVGQKLKRSEFRSDQASVKFYRDYELNTYNLIKFQRMYYQQLFLKEKNFKKVFDGWIAPETLEAYNKAQRLTGLAIKYATENKLPETVKSLEQYSAYVQALIFDVGSEYDLAVLTNNSKFFNKVFQPMLASDSIEKLNEAGKLLSYCKNYGRLSGSSLSGEFFNKQEMALASAISDLLDKQGREKELAKYTDQSVVAKFDTLNPCGVFKWHDQIVVIDEFNPASMMDEVKKGEAIIHADRMLFTYLEKNKLCSSVNELKFGYAFVIPYRSNTTNNSFFYNKLTDKWQYIACYTIIVNKGFTEQVSKFMPPLFFEDEMNTANK